MDALTPQQKKYLYDKIKRDILGISSLGFFDKTSHWTQFAKETFLRHGTLTHQDGREEHYSAAINNHLSGAALLHTLTQIDTMLKSLLEQE